MDEIVLSGAEKSYELHIRDIDKKKDTEEFIILRNKQSVHYKLSVALLETLNPFFTKRNTWLTIGDMMGMDAHFLIDQQQDVTASDIGDEVLKKSREFGFITKYTTQNAEKMSASDNSYDFVLVKEAYHHFPRAYLSIYELVRVCKKSVFILEPSDLLFKSPLLLALKNFLDWFSPTLINRIWKNRFSFEVVGNYVFKISEREVEKAAMGLGLPCIAFKQVNVLMLNDYSKLHKYDLNSRLWKQLKRKLWFKNLISKIGILPYNRLCCVLFKEAPDQNLKAQLKKEGYKVIDLPKNPYI